MNDSPEPSSRNWLYIISPCVIVGLFTLCIIIAANVEGGWSMIGAIVGVPFLAAIVLIDFVVKLIIKDKAGYVWLSEIVLIAIAIIILKQVYPF